MNNPYMHNKRKKADIKEQAKKAKKAKVSVSSSLLFPFTKTSFQ